MSKLSLAATIIAKNEAENLPRLFESLKDCVDEIYLTDTGSTDGTVEMAEKLGAKVSHFEWVNDFSRARNFNLSQCKTDYAFFIDCDDVLENKEQFKMWRENVMGLADYWMAKYIYSSDANGKPVCEFMRERIFRTDKGLEWKYFLHEGVIPQSPYGELRMQYTPSWWIKHMRTDIDLSKDRSRNISIFENHIKQGGKLDSRMQYYYGKELFEAGKPVEAVSELQKAVVDKSLEMHDRVLSYQYMCFAYMQCNQFERAIEFAQQGMLIAPQRAEFYSIIGDSFIKLGKWVDAAPWYNAAKSCINMGASGPSPIFYNEDSYTSYPRNQLARIYAHQGDFDKAIKESSESFEKYKSQEGKQLLDECSRLKSLSVAYLNAKECDDIVISCLPNAPYTWDHDTYKKGHTGGSETAAIEMATHLGELSGRKVKIFNMREDKKVFGNVEYYPISETAHYFADNKPYLHIAWRHNNKLTDAPTFVWSHDLQTPGIENLQNFTKVMCLTPFHKKYMMITQGVPEDKIYVTRNGIVPERFKDGPWVKDPNMFVFSSSPDRGLDRTIRVLDKVRLEFPEIKLHVFYGIEHLDKYGLGDLKNKLKSMMEERKEWVIYHGGVDQETLITYFKKAAYCVQPSDFVETSMISAVERLCSGVYQIMRKVGGAVDTLQKACDDNMATMVDSDCITESQYQLFVDATLKAMRDEVYKRVSVDAESFAWKKVAQTWLDDLSNMAYNK